MYTKIYPILLALLLIILPGPKALAGGGQWAAIQAQSDGNVKLKVSIYRINSGESTYIEIPMGEKGPDNSGSLSHDTFGTYHFEVKAWRTPPLKHARIKFYDNCEMPKSNQVQNISYNKKSTYFFFSSDKLQTAHHCYLFKFSVKLDGDTLNIYCNEEAKNSGCPY